MGRLTENSVVVHQEQVARGHRRGRRSRRAARSGADRRAGRGVRRLEPLRSRTAGRRTATTCSASSGSRSTATTAVPPGEHQVRVEFAYDGGGLGKGGTRDALRRRRPRSARGGSTRPCRWSSPPTRRPTSAATPATPVTRRPGEGETDVQRPGPLGPDRPRRRRRGRRPPDLARGALPGRDGAPVSDG